MTTIEQLKRDLKIYVLGIIILSILSIASYIINQNKTYDFLILATIFFIIFMIGFFNTKQAIKTYSKLIEKSEKELKRSKNSKV